MFIPILPAKFPRILPNLTSNVGDWSSLYISTKFLLFTCTFHSTAKFSVPSSYLISYGRYGSLDSYLGCTLMNQRSCRIGHEVCNIIVFHLFSITWNANDQSPSQALVYNTPFIEVEIWCQRTLHRPHKSISHLAGGVGTMVIIKEAVLAFANEALGKFIMTLALAPSCR